MSNTTEDPALFYKCQTDDGLTCASDCIGLEECSTCQCAVLPESVGGPWGPVMDVLLCLLPILYLVIVTLKPNPTATTTSLPVSAVLLFLVRVMYLGSDPLLTCASVILGLHEALTPLSIMAGAITLFETMEATLCMPFMMREIKALTDGHPVSEVMLLFSFAYLVEGASGFGTPVALGAPMLVSQGHDALKSVVVLLLFNTFATVWGAVGTPIWFGFGELGLTPEDFLRVSQAAAIALAIGSVILMPFLVRLIVPWPTVKQNLIFIYLSLLGTVGPSLGIAFISYEFPSLIGGLVGCVLSALIITFKLGLKPLSADAKDALGRDHLDIASVSTSHGIVHEYHKSASNVSAITDGGGGGGEQGVTEMAGEEESPDEFHDAADASDDLEESEHQNGDTNGVFAENTGLKPGLVVPANRRLLHMQSSLQETLDERLGPRKTFKEGYMQEILLRTFPIWGVVLTLILTRVDEIGIKTYLQQTNPAWVIFFNTYGTFRLSVSVVLQLQNILTYPGLNWTYQLFYVPFILPFVVISLLTMLFFRKDMRSSPWQIAKIVGGRLANPAIALMGALALVQLMIRVGDGAPASILGNILAQWFREGFVVISPLLGALGSFFSGSTTVSNLTFGEIQQTAAERIGVAPTAMLALQAVGGSAGNGICLNNIISACAVVGLNVGEGQILKRTYLYVFANTTIATIVMLAFYFRF